MATFAHFGAIENTHSNHILDLSVAPARVPAGMSRPRPSHITRAIMEELDYVGVLCVEFFLTRDGRLLVNEIAPRPHNSGHLTVRCVRHQPVRAAGARGVRLAAGIAPTQMRPAAMVNLLGDLWVQRRARLGRRAGDSRREAASYGKTDPRRGRKMGHLTALADTVDEAVEKRALPRAICWPERHAGGSS